MRHDIRAIVMFVASAYALAIALSLVVGWTGGYASPLIGLRFLSMFLPAVAVLIVNVAMKEPPYIDSKPFPWKHLPVALFLIPIVLHAVMLPAMAREGPLPWQDWLTPQSDGLYHSPAT